VGLEEGASLAARAEKGLEVGGPGRDTVCAAVSACVGAGDSLVCWMVIKQTAASSLTDRPASTKAPLHTQVSVGRREPAVQASDSVQHDKGGGRIKNHHRGAACVRPQPQCANNDHIDDICPQHLVGGTLTGVS